MTTALAAFANIKSGFHQAGKYTYTYGEILADVTNVETRLCPNLAIDSFIFVAG
jgi:hypothetical protein